MTAKTIASLTRRVFIYGLVSWCFLLCVIPFKPAGKAIGMAKKNRKKPLAYISGPVRRIKRGPASVVVEPCATYEPGDVYRALVTALSKLGYSPPGGKTVLLKPNIIAQNTPGQATTTHPSIVDAACRFFMEHSCTVSIGDSSAFYQGGGTAVGFETSGIAAVARKYGAALIPFETTRLRKITSGLYLNPFYVTEAVFSHDIIVNLPKLKVHRLARYSGGIKNMYGCVAGGTKQVYHRLFQGRPDYQEFWGKPLVDVFEAVEPDLTVMDAVIGLDKDGPAANGEPRFTGLLLASESAPALDVVSCRIAGIDIDRVPAVREAINRGLVSEKNITVRGPVPTIEYVTLPDLEPKKGLLKKIDDYVFDQFIVVPVIYSDTCTRCDDCIEGCATGAISRGTDGLPQIDYGKCIYCYCCESYCRHKAIGLAGSVPNRLIRAARYLLKI